MRQRKSWSKNKTKTEKENTQNQRLRREGRWGFYLQMGPHGPQNAPPWNHVTEAQVPQEPNAQSRGWGGKVGRGAEEEGEEFYLGTREKEVVSSCPI